MGFVSKRKENRERVDIEKKACFDGGRELKGCTSQTGITHKKGDTAWAKCAPCEKVSKITYRAMCTYIYIDAHRERGESDQWKPESRFNFCA